MAMFSGFVCGHCENTVGGPFWRCVECVSFDICDRCAHNSQHTLLRIETVEDVKALMQDAYGKGAHPEDCEITIGLRVYTLKDAEPTIRGSLRQGQILRGIFNQQSSQSTVRKETVKRKRTPIPSINEPKPKRRATRASLKP
ncbi:hypothetical protein NEOLEDRAFT_1133711 [Neolentinus lepideus HHB14362 ss-1]|uniref:Uncharacterized protein n=1 Tax=Neolentinus lepideus HHB14362 ss-1 TaxID=1314782 RepID=A0A165SLF2_9AGAM|nr:hypothetical protein NEOLEDRAFT_1133711 [Neolentinus lepideus HHB14362 ss-1]